MSKVFEFTSQAFKNITVILCAGFNIVNQFLRVVFVKVGMFSQGRAFDHRIQPFKMGTFDRLFMPCVGEFLHFKRNTPLPGRILKFQYDRFTSRGILKIIIPYLCYISIVNWTHPVRPQCSVKYILPSFLAIFHDYRITICRFSNSLHQT